MKYNDRLNQLSTRKENYIYPVQIIRDKSYKEVTDIFVRVNTSGTRLRSSDLALAQITSTWPGSMRLFESFVDQCIEKGFYLDENFLARCVVCIATGQPRFENIGRISAVKLREAWEQTKKGIQKTINFVKNSGLVDNSALLPSPILLIPLVYEATRSDLSKTEDSERALLYWFYNAAIWGRYSGSMETRLAQDLGALSGEGSWKALTENIWQTVGKDRRPTVEDFRGKGINSPLFFMMYILARQNKARDLETGDMINYTNFGTNNEIEFDHIFPKSKLDSFYKGKLEDNERKKIVNEISNLAFMTKKGNIVKTNDDPASYFPKVQKAHKGDNLFARQQIPSSPGLLHYEKYEEFLQERANLLASEMNAFLGSLKRQRS